MPRLALVTAIAGAILASVLSRYLTGTATLSFPWGRQTATNLVAVRSNAAPKIWLVAHLDSKSQTIPMLLRIVALSALAVFYGLLIVALAALAMMSSGFPPEGMEVLHHRLVHTVEALAHLSAFSALPLMFGFTARTSPGALDNATGVASVLVALPQISRLDVGVLFTSAEELGLAGARAFVMGNRAPAVAIDCDTIDDAGDFICMARGRRSRRLDASIDRAARRTGITTRPPMGSGYARLRRMLPGVLADNIPFTDAGWESFTLSRGNLGTLARVHTSRDRADPIDGTGIALAALLIAGTVEETN